MPFARSMMAPVLISRVLYVEDNDLVREITLELLAVDGRELVAAASAEEALVHFRSQPVDLVITDVSLPVMSGLDLARSLLRLQPGLPIIIASGYSIDFGTRELGPSVRALIKPFEAADVERLISELTSPAI